MEEISKRQCRIDAAGFGKTRRLCHDGAAVATLQRKRTPKMPPGTGARAPPLRIVSESPFSEQCRYKLRLFAPIPLLVMVGNLPNVYLKEGGRYERTETRHERNQAVSELRFRRNNDRNTYHAVQFLLYSRLRRTGRHRIIDRQIQRRLIRLHASRCHREKRRD
jgi:hypothetical protein